MKTLCSLLMSAVLLMIVSPVAAQNRVLIGISEGGGLVFQTLHHEGRGNIHSEMKAIGKGSRTESHARFKDGDDTLAPAPVDLEPEEQVKPVQPEVIAKPAATTTTAPAAGNGDGGHLICTLKPDGHWRACGLTPELTKAQHTANVLVQQGIQARVFQFMPLPAEVQQLPLLPNETAIGVAVKLTGEIYGVTKDGRLIEIEMPANPGSE